MPHPVAAATSKKGIRFAEKTRVSTCEFADRVATTVCRQWFRILDHSDTEPAVKSSPSRAEAKSATTTLSSGTMASSILDSHMELTHHGADQVPTLPTLHPPPFKFQQTVLAGFVVARQSCAGRQHEKSICSRCTQTHETHAGVQEERDPSLGHYQESTLPASPETDAVTTNLECVALGVGTKFLPPSHRPTLQNSDSEPSWTGSSDTDRFAGPGVSTVIADMHAEALAHRGLQRYLLSQMKAALAAHSTQQGSLSETFHSTSDGVDPDLSSSSAQKRCGNKLCEDDSCNKRYRYQDENQARDGVDSDRHTHRGTSCSCRNQVDAGPSSSIFELAVLDFERADAAPTASSAFSTSHSTGSPSTPSFTFYLKPGITFHLYTSSAPCGNSTVRQWVGNKGDRHYTAGLKHLFGPHEDDIEEKRKEGKVEPAGTAEQAFSINPLQSQRWIEEVIGFHGQISSLATRRHEYRHQLPLTPCLSLHPVINSVARGAGQFSATYKHRMYDQVDRFNDGGHDDSIDDGRKQKHTFATMNEEPGMASQDHREDTIPVRTKVDDVIAPPQGYQCKTADNLAADLPPLCCSDLIALWNAVGIQGRWIMGANSTITITRGSSTTSDPCDAHTKPSLLRDAQSFRTAPLLLRPLYISTLTVGRKYNFPALQRALCCRLDLVGRPDGQEVSSHCRILMHRNDEWQHQCQSSPRAQCNYCSPCRSTIGAPGDIAASLAMEPFPPRITGGSKGEKAAIRALLHQSNERGATRQNYSASPSSGGTENGAPTKTPLYLYPALPPINHPALLCTSVLFEPPGAGDVQSTEARGEFGNGTSAVASPHNRAVKEEGEGAVFDEPRCVVWWRRPQRGSDEGDKSDVIQGGKNERCVLWHSGEQVGLDPNYALDPFEVADGWAECLHSADGLPSPWPVRRMPVLSSLSTASMQTFVVTTDARMPCSTHQSVSEGRRGSAVSDEALLHLCHQISSYSIQHQNHIAIAAPPSASTSFMMNERFVFDYERYEEVLLTSELLLKPISKIGCS